MQAPRAANVAEMRKGLSAMRCKAAVVVAVVASVLLAGCTGGPSADQTPSPSAEPQQPSKIAVSVYGAEPVLEAYRGIAKEFNKRNPKIRVSLQEFSNHDAAMAHYRESAQAGTAPDLFMITGDDLGQLIADGVNAPVDELLGARGLNFGDGYERVALEAFSADSHLQCLPTEVSPMVVYYNPALVPMDRLAEPDGEAPTAESGWSFHQFAKAARKASTPRVRGVEVPKDLQHLAPFVLGGGGSLVDDVTAPTTTTLSTPESIVALRPLLRLLRNPRYTFTPEQLARRGAVQRFVDGRLAMLVGDRSLTPVLRAHEGFAFGAMPMPRRTKNATVATMTGFCLSKSSSQPEAAADFLADLASTKSALSLVATGYAVPTNVAALRSADFAAAGMSPVGSLSFTDQMRAIQPMPTGPQWNQLVSRTRPEITRLLVKPVISPLRRTLGEFDRASVELLKRPEQ